MTPPVEKQRASDLPQLAPDDVHEASTTVSPMPHELLESLKQGGRRPSDSLLVPSTTPSSSGIRPPAPPTIPDDAALVDLADLVSELDASEPETLQLETLLLAMPGSAPLDPSLAEYIDPPEIIEIHVEAPAETFGALDVIEREIAQLPRWLQIAGPLIASVVIAGFAAALMHLLSR